MKLTKKRREFLETAKAIGLPKVVTNLELECAIEAGQLDGKPWWIVNDMTYRAGRGAYRIPYEMLENNGVAPVATPPTKTPRLRGSPTGLVAPKAPVAVAAPVVVEMAKASSMVKSAVPERFVNYVPFGHFKDVEAIVRSGMFYPVFITGLSGNGKTLMVDQVCSKTKREMFRVNITIETDEDDLLGGFRLVNGETVWFDGPVVEAMRRGAVLLLDEIDLASNKVMCLQPVLEGKPILLKKINEIVAPADGFTVIATANTKGKGDEAGRFIGTNVLNEAFLERFPITLEQEYPSKAVETKIINKELESAGRPDAEFAKKLVDWADIIRKTFYDGGVDEIIATRRLVHITKAYGIFADRMKALTLALNRFDTETKETFLDLYTKVDETVEHKTADNDAAKPVTTTTDEDDTSDLTPF